jgi:uncharacterized protein (TIGR02271 family)
MRVHTVANAIAFSYVPTDVAPYLLSSVGIVLQRKERAACRMTQKKTQRGEEGRPEPPNVASEADVDRQNSLVVPLIEERLDVRKQRRKAGELVVRKDIETRTETVPVDLGYEELSVERVPVNRVLAEGERAEQRQEGDVIIIPVVEEELVVLKRQVVREELRITRHRRVRHENVTDTIRREQLTLEPSGDLHAKNDDG